MSENAQLPSTFCFTYGCWEESQQLEWQDGALVYRPNAWSPAEVISPTTGAWQEFWTAAELVKLWSWRKEYINPLTLDGLQWSLEISSEDAKIVCNGSNAVPGWESDPEFPDDCDFGRFLEAVANLTGGRFHP